MKIQGNSALSVLFVMCRILFCCFWVWEDDDDEDCCNSDEILEGMRRNKVLKVRTVMSRLGNKYEFPLIQQTRAPRRVIPCFCPDRLPDLDETVDEDSSLEETKNPTPPPPPQKKFGTANDTKQD